MAVVTFYEKPGCKGNLRQKTLLAAAGHTVQAKSLKVEAWTADRLLAFLGKLPVSDWFNPSAPAIKSGEIVPENISFEHALRLLAHGMAHLCGLDHGEQMDAVSQVFMDAAIQAVATVIGFRYFSRSRRDDDCAVPERAQV